MRRSTQSWTPCLAVTAKAQNLVRIGARLYSASVRVAELTGEQDCLSDFRPPIFSQVGDRGSYVFP